MKIVSRRGNWRVVNGWWQWIEDKEQATTVILGRVVRRGVKRRHAHPLLSRLEKDYLNSPPYRSSPNLYEPHSALVSGVSLSNPASVSLLLLFSLLSSLFSFLSPSLLSFLLFSPLLSSSLLFSPLFFSLLSPLSSHLSSLFPVLGFPPSNGTYRTATLSQPTVG